jgi:hypothetical protein
MKLHRFNDEGLHAFSGYLEVLRNAPNISVPTELLTDARYSAVVSEGEVEQKIFPTRFAFAKYAD